MYLSLISLYKYLLITAIAMLVMSKHACVFTFLVTFCSPSSLHPPRVSEESLINPICATAMLDGCLHKQWCAVSISACGLLGTWDSNSILRNHDLGSMQDAEGGRRNGFVSQLNHLQRQALTRLAHRGQSMRRAEACEHMEDT